MNDLRSTLSYFLPAIHAETAFSKRMRGTLLWTTGAPALISFIAFVMLHALSVAPIRPELFLGIFLVCVSAYLSILFVSFYLNAVYFSGVYSVGSEVTGQSDSLSYEAAHIISLAPHDLTAGFLLSPYGSFAMTRAGVSPQTLRDFLSQPNRAAIDPFTLPADEKTPLNLEHIASYIYGHDTAFKECVFRAGVREDIFFGAVSWVARVYAEEKYRARWWSRDAMGKVRGIGAEFSFGVAYSLQRFIRDLESATVFSGMADNAQYGKDTLAKVEKTLARAKEANVLLVAEPGVGEMDILAVLSRKMSTGQSVASIEGKHLVLFDTEAFVATYATKQDFERELIRLLNGAAHAGNLIIVMAHIGSLLRNASALSVDLEEIIDPYLASSGVQFIGTSDPETFHHVIETRPRFMQRFEAIHVEAPPLAGTVRVLEDVAPTHEAHYGIFFTYGSLHQIAESAERYITEGVMPDKAVDLLVEISAAAGADKVDFITESYVQESISKKTGIPTGPITTKERDLLMHLEDTLHSYVVGQEPAIDAIADAMRRARAGVQTAGRPMGSFMFLGPTGVGKTETAKALARVFFGDETRMLRLDMSEYNSAEGFGRLLGSQDQTGKLSDMLHEHPYGVLLLDEFEKGAREVHDLFLQILDEGVYTDGRGKQVNARNTIIIATSNAGSEIIWDMVGKGEHPREHKDEIVEHIIQKGIYRPELLNRFDGVIIFEPLSETQMHDIAKIMLKGLAERIKGKGYTLVINDALANTLVEKGYDPVFGVRPMRRAMQDVVEGKIAEKIISGGLRPGDNIEFTPEDLKDV